MYGQKGSNFCMGYFHWNLEMISHYVFSPWLSFSISLWFFSTFHPLPLAYLSQEVWKSLKVAGAYGMLLFKLVICTSHQPPVRFCLPPSSTASIVHSLVPSIHLKPSTACTMPTAYPAMLVHCFPVSPPDPPLDAAPLSSSSSSLMMPSVTSIIILFNSNSHVDTLWHIRPDA